MNVSPELFDEVEKVCDAALRPFSDEMPVPSDDVETQVATEPFDWRTWPTVPRVFALSTSAEIARREVVALVKFAFVAKRLVEVAFVVVPFLTSSAAIDDDAFNTIPMVEVGARYVTEPAPPANISQVLPKSMPAR